MSQRPFSLSTQSAGFTLIEIVMVLVLLGILSAVAAGKYFDLQEQAAKQAQAQTLSVLQAAVHQRFAQHILQDKSCQSFLAADNVAKLKDELNKELDDTIPNNTLRLVTTTEQTLLLVNGKTATAASVGKVQLPTCN